MLSTFKYDLNNYSDKDYWELNLSDTEIEKFYKYQVSLLNKARNNVISVIKEKKPYKLKEYRLGYLSKKKKLKSDFLAMKNLNGKIYPSDSLLKVYLKLKKDYILSFDHQPFRNILDKNIASELLKFVEDPKVIAKINEVI